jgi:hypothetical protein
LAYVLGTWLASKRNANKRHRSLVAIIVFPSPNKNGKEKHKMQRRPTGCSFYYFCVDVRGFSGALNYHNSNSPKGLARGPQSRTPPSKVYFPYKVIDYEFLSQNFSGGDSYTFAPLCLQRLKQQTLFNDEKWGDTPQERKILCVLCRKKVSLARRTFIKKFGEPWLCCSAMR